MNKRFLKALLKRKFTSNANNTWFLKVYRGKGEKNVFVRFGVKNAKELYASADDNILGYSSHNDSTVSSVKEIDEWVKFAVGPLQL